MIPSAFIDRAEILEHGKEYNLVFEVPDEIRKNGNHWSLSHHSEIMSSFLNVSRNFSDSSQIQTFL
jgi:hypothetical protein